MIYQASSFLKVSYRLVLLGAILPFGLSKSSWVSLITGHGIFSIIPYAWQLVFLVVGVYRIYLVTRFKGTLDALPVSGIAATLRSLGVFCLYIGAIITLLNWFSGPLMHMFMTHRTESGAEFVVIGWYLSLVTGIGYLGLLLFEFSRLLAFERQIKQNNMKE